MSETRRRLTGWAAGCVAILLVSTPSLVAAATPPSAPSDVRVTAASCTQLSLAWTASIDNSGAGLRGYNIYRSGYFVKLVAPTATSTVDVGLSPARSYTYEMAALDNAGNLSARSTPLVATTPTCPDATPPSVPAGVTAVADGCSQTTIRWQASTDTGGAGLRGYNLYRNGAFVKQLGASVLSTTDTGLVAQVRYEYTVAALDNAGNRSGLSATAGAITPSCGTVDSVPPSTPTGVAVTSASCSQLNVSWSASTDTGGAGLDSYVVYRNGGMIRQVPASTRSIADTGLSGNVLYGYAVVALDAAGNYSSASAAVSGRTPACADTVAPSVPAGLSASAASCSQVNVSWAASSDAGSGVKAYNLFRNGVLVRQVAAPATSTADVGLAASTVYGYAVSALDAAGNQSARGATVSVNTPVCPDSTPPAVPSGLSASATTCSQANLAWSATTDTGGAGLRGYNVYRNGAYVKLVLAPATSTSDTGLTASTVYSYALAAVDNAGNTSARGATVTATTPSCTPSPPASGLVGYVPSIGIAKDVTVVGGRAYVASAEFGLAIADVSTPSSPVVLGGANQPFYSERVDVAGNLAVLTGNGLGLKVVDIANPRAPRVVGALAGTMKGLATVGDRAYVLEVIPGNPARTDLVVINLAGASVPNVMGRVNVASATEVDVVGSLAFLAARADGLQIVDVVNPAAPRVVATVNTAGTAKDVVAAGGYAYIADGTSVVVIDIRAPSAPVVVGSVATPASSLALAGSRLYVVDGLHLMVVDVSNPAKPLVLSTTDGYGAQAVAAVGTTVYLASPDVDASSGRGGLYVIDASSPTAPRLLKNLYGGFDNWGVGVAGTTGIVAGNALGLRVVDVSAPTAPRLLASLPGTMKGVTMAGSYAYAILVTPGNPPRVELLVVDLRSPAAPVVAGRVTLPNATDVRVVGSLVYVAAAESGLRIVDVSAPTAPRIVGAVDTPGSVQAVAVHNGYAYVADTQTVVAIDVRTPSLPAVRGSVTTAATAIAADARGLYVLGGLQLKVFDLANPIAPVLRSTSDGFGAQALLPTGSLLILATPGLNHFDASRGLFVLDVSNTAAPRLLRRVALPGLTRTLASANGYVYAGDSAGVLDVVVP